jgi:hypothetical protein
MLIGSRAGLLGFCEALRSYASVPGNEVVGEHQHYGPYGYLVVTTSNEADLDGRGIRGPLAELARLARLIETKLSTARPGASIAIKEEFAIDSEYSLFLELREDSFDPATADPLLPPENAPSSS